MSNSINPAGGDNARSISETLGLNGTIVGDLVDQLAAATGLDKLVATPSPLERFGSQPGSKYTVKSGDTLDQIAKQHGTTWQQLAKDNGLSNAQANLIRPGQQLILPAGASTTHVVKRGDTLSSIAAANGTTVAQLKANNPQIKNGNLIYPGDEIRIGGRRAAAANTGQPGSAAGGAARPTAPQAPKAPSVKTPSAMAPIAAQTAAGSTTGSKINLQAFFDPAKGSQAPAAIIIGNAEGNRTPSGGFRAGYAGHIDPGNGKGNRGSFSYQHGTKGMTPEQADKAQLSKLSKLIPAYEAAVKKAGLDPNDATLATAYFDLYNQSESAAARFLNQVGDLKATGITNQSVTDLRFHSFVDKSTGRRFTAIGDNGKPYTVAGGFANIARDNLGRKPTEAEVQSVIRRDQSRRQNDMQPALKAQGYGGKSSPQTPTAGPVAQVAPGSTTSNVLTKWPVSKPQLNAADKSREGDGHYHTRRGKSGKHGGIDLVGRVGDPIFAAGAGKVVDIRPNPSKTFGYQIVIDHGNGVFTQYAHLQKGSLKVQPGDTVKAGETIAGMGRSGNTPIKGDTHLHFEVRLGSAKPASVGGKTDNPLKYLGKL